MSDCGHPTLYDTDFTNQPRRREGCLLCERDELQSKLHSCESKLHMSETAAAEMLEENRRLERDVAAWRQFFHQPEEQSIAELKGELDATQNRLDLAMNLLHELGADNQFYYDRAKVLLDALKSRRTAASWPISPKSNSRTGGG